MAIKQKITKVVYDALSEELKKEYKLVGVDYVLDLEGYEDPVELKRAKDREAQNAREAKALLTTTQAELDALKAAQGSLDDQAARKAGDIATLEKSWQAKLDTSAAEFTGKLSKKDAYIQSQLVDSVAHQLAAKIAQSPSIILPHIKARLQADLTGDVPVTRVLDSTGKVSAMSLAELEKEFVTNPDFAAIIIASNGSGGGAPGGKQNGGGAAKKLSEMTGTERAEYYKRDPAGFEREAAAVRSAGPQI